MAAEIMYEDEFGEIIDRPDAGFIEIRWFDGTAALDRDAFNQWLAVFAGAVEDRRRPGALIDGLAFRMDPAEMDGPWRDANIIPRYNHAGVRKFAFLMPEGMPLIGAEPAAEGPAHFPTGYFGRRQDAVAWLGS